MSDVCPFLNIKIRSNVVTRIKFCHSFLVLSLISGFHYKGADPDCLHNGVVSIYTTRLFGCIMVTITNLGVSTSSGFLSTFGFRGNNRKSTASLWTFFKCRIYFLTRNINYDFVNIGNYKTSAIIKK